MRRYVLIALALLSACPPTPPPPPPFRCSKNEQCTANGYSNYHCNTDLQTCETTCPLNQEGANDRAGNLMCVDASGPGAVCFGDGDCPNGFECRNLAYDATMPEQNSLPQRATCVETSTIRNGACGGMTAACPDSDPSTMAIDAGCVDLVEKSDSTKPPTTSICVDRLWTVSGPNISNPKLCRLDQRAALDSNNASYCTTLDPYGTTCTGQGTTCNGLPGPAWLGDVRRCRLVVPNNLRCVGDNFCAAETPATCTDGVSENCDGANETTSTVCQVKVCPDLDHDGYSEIDDCRTVWLGAIPENFTTDLSRHESKFCDGNKDLFPPPVPDEIPTTADLCFACEPGTCIPGLFPSLGEGCNCQEGFVCNAQTDRCQVQ
jgi:hypothetical protein